MQRHLLSPHVSLILPNRIHAKGELPLFRIEGRVTAVGLPPVVGWSKYALGQSGYGAFDEHLASLFGYRFRDDKIRASPIFTAIPVTTRRNRFRSVLWPSRPTRRIVSPPRVCQPCSAPDSTTVAPRDWQRDGKCCGFSVGARSRLCSGGAGSCNSAPLCTTFSPLSFRRRHLTEGLLTSGKSARCWLNRQPTLWCQCLEAQP